MSKRNDTRNAILAQALDLASEVGLEGLTIGVLAKLVGMSKSGLYAHFSSKENLQCEVLDTAAARFIEVVMTPALKQPRGEPRMRTLFAKWLTWEVEELRGGCPFISAATEFDDRPGLVRDRLLVHLQDLLGAISRAARICVEENQFRADLDGEQFAYECWAILVAYHHFSRLMHHQDAYKRANLAFERLVRDAKILTST